MENEIYSSDFEILVWQLQVLVLLLPINIFELRLLKICLILTILLVLKPIELQKLSLRLLPLRQVHNLLA